jgi:hypothetical protein
LLNVVESSIQLGSLGLRQWQRSGILAEALPEVLEEVEALIGLARSDRYI